MKEYFINYPNLPEGRVTLAAAGDYPEITAALAEEGIRTLSFSSDILPDEVKRHSDMLLCHAGSHRIFAVPGINTSELKKTGFSVYLSDDIKAEYPLDVKLNVAVGKGFYICNPKTADSYLTDELILSGFTAFHTNQGYSKCSVCFVADNAIITEDPSIYQSLQRSSFDILLISQGDIYLSEKHSGFFGGSTGKISKDTLAVTGELKYHKDENRIRCFCEKHEVKIKELRKGRIIDIGSILPLLEMR